MEKRWRGMSKVMPLIADTSTSPSLIDFDNVRKTDYWSACVFGFRDLSQSLRFHFCPCLSILWVKRYVLCSVTARQP
jgi:hypothetical protein